jgi:hypothetical protein
MRLGARIILTETEIEYENISRNGMDLRPRPRSEIAHHDLPMGDVKFAGDCH